MVIHPDELSISGCYSSRESEPSEKSSHPAELSISWIWTFRSSIRVSCPFREIIHPGELLIPGCHPFRWIWIFREVIIHQRSHHSGNLNILGDREHPYPHHPPEKSSFQWPEHSRWPSSSTREVITVTFQTVIRWSWVIPSNLNVLDSSSVHYSISNEGHLDLIVIRSDSEDLGSHRKRSSRLKQSRSLSEEVIHPGELSIPGCHLSGESEHSEKSSIWVSCPF